MTITAPPDDATVWYDYNCTPYDLTVWYDGIWAGSAGSECIFAYGYMCISKCRFPYRYMCISKCRFP